MRWKSGCALVFAGALLLGSSLAVCAEEVEPAGYHVYEVQEDEASDTWYGTARGAYLQAGTAKLTHGDPGYALCSGFTMAHKVCDRVYVRIYLDESDNGIDGWGTLDYWTGITYNDSTASARSGQYKITSGKYYSVKGIHSVTKGTGDDAFTETTTTCTNALLFD